MGRVKTHMERARKFIAKREAAKTQNTTMTHADYKALHKVKSEKFKQVLDQVMAKPVVARQKV